ncbi:MAG: CHAT domain-containing protein [Dokdonella sp.]
MAFAILFALCRPLLADEIAADAAMTRTELLAAGQTQHYRVELDAGDAVELSLHQTGDVGLELRWTAAGASTLARQTEAGRGATLRAVLRADTKTVWSVDVAATKQDSAAAYGFTRGPAHAASAVDRARASATSALARAEALRHADGANAAQTQAAYQESLLQAQRGKDECLLRDAYVALSGFRHEAGDAAGQRAAAQTALQQHCVGDLAEQALAERLLGSAHINQGEFAAGVDATERAVALFRQTGDEANQAVALRNLGLAYAESGASEKALVTTLSALKLAEAVGDRRLQLLTRGDIAFQYNARGEYAAAIEAYQRTLDELRATPNPMAEAVAWVNLGVAYSQLGEVGEAGRAYAKAEAAATAADCWSCLAEIAANEGDTLSDDGRSQEAAVAYRRALDIAQDHQLLRQHAEALRGLGRCAMASGDWPAARALLEAAQGELHRTHGLVNEAVVESMLGDLESRQSHFDAARQHYRRSRTLARQAANQPWQTVASASLARLAAQAGDLEAAKRDIERAITAIESERARINAPDLRTSYFGTMRAYYELYVDILMQLEARQPGHAYAATALIAAERARARVLQDQLTERATPLDKDIDPALLTAAHAAADRLHALAYRHGQTQDDAAARATLQSGIDEATRQLDEARGRIRAANPRYADLTHPTPLRIDEIQQQLLDGDVSVLEYWLGERRSYLWVITRDALQAYTLPPRAQIEQAVAALREKLIARAAVTGTTSIEQLATRDARDSDAVRALAQTLAEQIVPAAARVNLRRQVVVVADGDLQSLPLPLRILQDAPAQDGTASAAPHIFAYLPSLGSLRSLRALPHSTQASNALAILADPVFRADDVRLQGRVKVETAKADELLLRAASEAGISELARLPSTRSEAEAIAALAKADATWLALDFAANRQAALAADWSNYAIVHFATHALLNPNHPELSGIVLSLYDAQGKAEDGFVRMNDIYNLHMPAELVVLSVCDSALGRSLGGEGASSLARAFFYAGAHRVVASLWPVDDRASAALMQAFYRGLLERHEAPAQALAGAQREISSDPRWQAPFYWAGFVLQGDWR